MYVEKMAHQWPDLNRKYSEIRKRCLQQFQKKSNVIRIGWGYKETKMHNALDMLFMGTQIGVRGFSDSWVK